MEDGNVTGRTEIVLLVHQNAEAREGPVSRVRASEPETREEGTAGDLVELHRRRFH